MTMYVLTSTYILSMLAPVEFVHTGQIKVGKYIWWCICERFVISQHRLVDFHRGVLVRGPALSLSISLLCTTPRLVLLYKSLLINAGKFSFSPTYHRNSYYYGMFSIVKVYFSILFSNSYNEKNS